MNEERPMDLNEECPMDAKEERDMDRRNRRWGSLRYSVPLKVRLSRRTMAILSALRNCEEQQISYGAVIDRLVEEHATLLGQDDQK